MPEVNPVFPLPAAAVTGSDDDCGGDPGRSVPEGLAAVAVPGASPSIDLSWQPDTESWLAGYAVYRREGSGEWRKVSGEQPVTGPGFHDANVQAGHSYEYAVTALGTNSRESARSNPAQESVPEP